MQLLPTEQPHLHSSGRWELTFLRRVAHDQLFGDGLLQSPAAQAAAVPYRIGGESFPSGLPVFTTAILPHPVYELLNIICGQLVQRNVTEPWADIQADIIFVACPCVWPDGGFTAGLIPECHPLAEGHICPDLDSGCGSHGLFQRFQFRHALPLGLGKDILRLGQPLVIIADDHSPLPAAVLSQSDSTLAAFALSSHGLNSSPKISVRKSPTTSDARFCISPVVWV